MKSLVLKNFQNSVQLILVLVLLSLSAISFSQGVLKAEIRNTNCPVAHYEAYTWYFGQNAGIDFLQDPRAALTDMWGYNMPQCSAVLSDSTGKLLLYTDGKNVWDSRRLLMPNGTGLDGNPGLTQPAIIVPNPEDPDIYYIFTLDIIRFFPTDTTKKGLRYSEVDMSLNNGYGDVTEVKNVPLLPEVSSKVTAVKHQNGVDYWVVAHKWNSKEFCAFPVTSGGVNENYVSSNLGATHQGDIFENNFIGNMKFSHDGSKLALAINGTGIFEILNFNNASGGFSNAVTSAAVYDNAYGVAFSPNMDYLYGTAAFTGSGTDTSELWQFNINAGSGIFNNPYLVAEDTTGIRFCALQIGPDGEIYVARASNTVGLGSVSVIYNPNRPGAECNFNLLSGATTTFDLAGKNSSWGMPNFMQTYFDLPHFDVDSICHYDMTYLKLRNEANITSILWDFDDPASSNNTSTDIRPVHEFSEAGVYNVTVTETYNGADYTYSEQVIVNEIPFVDLGDTVYMYQGSSIKLDAGPDMDYYWWSTQETSQFITINEPGTYWVVVENYKCCFNMDSVVVLLFDVLVPNAFRPGGVNDIFKVYVSAGTILNKFEMYIYNRWGQLVFESNDVENGWDGTYKGQEAPGDVYVWLINYYVERDGSEERVTFKGNVMLLR